MRYIGNKMELMDLIEKPLIEHGVRARTFCDIFSGTANVSKYFKRKYKIISNDNMVYSYVFQKAHIENNKTNMVFNALSSKVPDQDLAHVIKYLNKLKGKRGFMFKNFCAEGSTHTGFARNYFSAQNAMKMDAIRDAISDWLLANKINELEYYVLLSCLIEAVPSVSNTSGTYGAYLKINDPRMYLPLTLQAPRFVCNRHSNKCYNEDANHLIKKVNTDIIYIDPPYNHRQYPSNYHVLETLAVWDKKITSTKSGLREWGHQRSLYCSKRKCADVFDDLIQNCNVRYILFSYNSEGIMSFDTIMRTLSTRGNVTHYARPYRRFKSHSRGKHRRCNLEEWLFFVQC